MEEQTGKQEEVKKIKELEIDGDRIYLKKDFLGWRLVNPYKIDGKLNWTNVLTGGWRNLIMLVGLLSILGILMFAHFHDIEGLRYAYEYPSSYCNQINSQINVTCSEPMRLGGLCGQINISKINLSIT